MAHVPGNGSIDFFISGRFYYDGDVVGLREQWIGAVSRDPGVFLKMSVVFCGVCVDDILGAVRC